MAIVRGVNFPDGLYYAVEHHAWAEREADGKVTVGITSLGGALSGDYLAFVPKRVGTEVEQNRSGGFVEMAKTIGSVRGAGKWCHHRDQRGSGS